MTAKYKLRITGECKQNMKLCKRRGLPMDELWTVVGKLLNGEQLEEKYHAHILTGDRKGQWECHIRPDWLLIWEIRDQELVLVLLNTGSHSDPSCTASGAGTDGLPIEKSKTFSAPISALRFKPYSKSSRMPERFAPSCTISFTSI